MSKQKTKFSCQECGYDSPKWMGKCPGCQSWNTMVEEIETVVRTQGMTSSIPQNERKSNPHHTYRKQL